MKILVREYDNNETCNYVWKKIRAKKPFYCGEYYTTDGRCYDLTQILRIKQDYRKLNYVQCEVCGEVVKRDKVVRHYEDQEQKANCAKCNWFEIDDYTKITYSIRNDGTAVAKSYGTPYCTQGSSWYRRHKKLSDVDKVTECKYFACRRGEIRELYSDFMSQNPDPYMNLLTENAVIAHGWRYFATSLFGRSYSTGDGKLIARFDKNGILMDFNFFHRNTSYVFVYSDVYDKVVTRHGEFTWDGIANSTREKYMKLIRKLYH